MAAGELARDSHVASNLPRILVYKLGGGAALPTLPAVAPAVLDPPPDAATAVTVAAGKALYHTYCSNCHDDSATGSSVLPDLRYSSLIRNPETFDMAVHQEARADKNMVAFKNEITPENLEQIRAYVIHRASEDRKAEAATPSG